MNQQLSDMIYTPQPDPARVTRGRRKHDPAMVRSRVIQVRLTEREYARIRHDASASGLPFGVWCRLKFDGVAP